MTGPRLTLAQRCADAAQRRLELAPAMWNLWQWTSRSRAVQLAFAVQTRVYGIPIAAKAVTNPTLLEIDGRLFLACGAGVFLLSLTGAAPESFRRAMFDLVRKETRPKIIGRMEAPG